MEKLLRKLKIKNKNNQIIMEKYLDIGMECMNKEMKCVTTKYGQRERERGLLLNKRQKKNKFKIELQYT